MAQTEFSKISVEHDAFKVFTVHGTPRNGSSPVRLATIGDGADDPRSEETLQITAEACADAISELYWMDAMIRDREERGLEIP